MKLPILGLPRGVLQVIGGRGTQFLAHLVCLPGGRWWFGLAEASSRQLRTVPEFAWPWPPLGSLFLQFDIHASRL